MKEEKEGDFIGRGHTYDTHRKKKECQNTRLGKDLRPKTKKYGRDDVIPGYFIFSDSAASTDIHIHASVL